jgi:hypothetical protein
VSKPPAPAGSVVGTVQKVSCSSTSFCVAAGFYATNKTAFMLLDWWNGKTWATMKAQPPAAAKDDPDANGVSCRSRSSCVVVGVGTDVTGGRLHGLTAFTEVWNGAGWSGATISWPKGTTTSYLIGVSCATAARCLAVGLTNLNPNVGGNTGKAAAASWNGEAWTATNVPAPGKGKASVFNEVSCLSPASCVAVGQAGPFESTEGNGLSGFWNGACWKLVTAL